MLADNEKKVLKELVRRGYLDRDALGTIGDELQKDAVTLVESLLEKKIVSERELLQTIADVAGYTVVDARTVTAEPAALKKVAAKVAHHYTLLPVRYYDGVLELCIANPFNTQLMAELQALFVDKLHFVLSTQDAIRAGIKKQYGIGADSLPVDRAAQATDAGHASRVQATVDLDGDDSRIAKFVNQLLSEAKENGATDIHIEPFENELRVRYRIDGVLTDVPIPSDVKKHQASIIARIKIIADLDISEHRLPQDGRLKIRQGGTDMDLRISILPTAFGESVNIRLLSSNVLLGLESLGFEEDNLVVMRSVIAKPHGIILLTGPTGSGKTTTLYACLNQVNDGKKKIITIEDPIEYQMNGITQIQVQPKIGLNFSDGLRSMLRHDPDIMMVGEIRDIETAVIAMRVALTGHLVFSTLHTNDALSAVVRLIEMGVEPYLVSSGVECVVAQRLVRVLCPQCKKTDADATELLRKSPGMQQYGDVSAFAVVGCARCHGTGYNGRTAIHEVVRLTPKMRSLIARNASHDELRQAAVESGMRLLRDDGLIKVARGITSLDEVVRVTEDQATG